MPNPDHAGSASPLGEVPLFSGLSVDVLGRILETSERVRADAGEVLFSEGEEGDAFYVVLQGSIELAKAAAMGGYERLAVMKAGDSFGEMALVIDVPRSATARALEPAELLAISRQAFHEMVGDGVAYRLLKNVSRALWATSIRFAARQRAATEADTFSRDVSRVIQRSIQPDAPPTAPGFQISASLRLHDVGTGRSSWDWFPLLDGRTALVLARVEGEGLPAGHHLALVRAILREAAQTRSDLTALLARACSAVATTRVESMDQHVDCGLLALEAGEVEWAGAGRISASVVGADGRSRRLPCVNPSLGVQDFHPRSVRFALAPGDTVVGLSAASDEALRAAEEVVARGRSVRTTDLVGEVLGVITDLLEGNSREVAALVVRWTP